jgi:glycosyltransferase involved in cell wall biosynthesis
MPRLAASIEALKLSCDFPIETLYVDSASDDDGVALAEKSFDRVIELEANDQLCASAGRYVGTIEARYPWIFYIDADMEICEEFFSIIAQLEQFPEESMGCVGIYVHRFDNNTSAFQGFAGGVVKSNWAAYFGGAVILRRQTVLNAGNWNPSVFGKEEMELYARLGDGRRTVQYFGVPMINHYSEYFTRLELLMRLVSPSGGLGKVFYGYGQSIRSLLIAGKLGALVKLDVEPYLFWGLLLTGLLISGFLPVEWGALFAAAVLLWLSVWLRPGAVIRYLTLPLALFRGWFKYVPYFRPDLKYWSAGADKAA